jgi:hypothetical protein
LSTTRADFRDLQESVLNTSGLSNQSFDFDTRPHALLPIMANTPPGGLANNAAGPVAVVSAQDLAAQLGSLFSREEKKSIPFFKGKPEDTDV